MNAVFSMCFCWIYPFFRCFSNDLGNILQITKKVSIYAVDTYLHFFGCRLQESNQGHKDFQSFALPTELKRRARVCITQRERTVNRFSCKQIEKNFCSIVESFVWKTIRRR